MKKALSKKLFGPLMLLAAFFCPVRSRTGQSVKENYLGADLDFLIPVDPWIAKDAKIYEKYGLDVDIVYLRGGSGDT